MDKCKVKSQITLLMICLLVFCNFFHPPAMANESSLIRLSSSHVHSRKMNITFQEYEILLRKKISEIKDLSDLWIGRELDSSLSEVKDFYITGNIWIAFLYWFDAQLLEHSLESVEQMKPPSIDELVLEESKEIFLLGFRKHIFRSSYEDFSDWKVLEQFSPLLNERTDIENIAINPGRIHDPTGALERFYNGAIDFHPVPEVIFFKFGTKKLSINLSNQSNITLLIKHLTHLNLFDGLEISEQKVEQMQSIALDSVGKLKPHDHRVNAALQEADREYKKNGKKRLKLVNDLYEIGILKSLIENGYKFEDGSSLFVKGVDPEILLDIIKDKSFKFKKTTDNIEAIMKMIDKVIERASSASEFIDILTPGVSEPSEEYKEALSRRWIKHAELFMELKPSPDEFEKAKSTIKLIKGVIPLMREAARRAKTSEEFFDIFRPNIKNPNSKFLDAIDKLWEEFADEFIKAGASLSQFIQAKNLSIKIDTSLSLMRAALNHFKKPSLWVEILNPGVTSPADKYLDGIDELISENISLFVSLEPTISDFIKLESRIKSIKTEMSLKRAMLKRKGWTPGEVNEILEPSVISPSKSYRVALRSLKGEGTIVFEATQERPKKALSCVDVL